MDKFKAPVKQERSSSIPDYPAICMNGECNNETDIAFVKVRTAKGKNIVNAFSEIGYRDKSGLNMKNGYTFIRWISRCAKCHYSDLLVTHSVYFKRKWTERVSIGEVKDQNLSIDQAKHFMRNFGK